MYMMWKLFIYIYFINANIRCCLQVKSCWTHLALNMAITDQLTPNHPLTFPPLTPKKVDSVLSFYEKLWRCRRNLRRVHKGQDTKCHHDFDFSLPKSVCISCASGFNLKCSRWLFGFDKQNQRDNTKKVK